MSFIKRADGTTIYGGTHATVRPSLADIRHNGGREVPETPEDAQWLKKATAAMMGLGDSAGYDPDYFSEEAEIISKLWGVYYGTCPTTQRNFSEDCFSPHDH